MTLTNNRLTLPPSSNANRGPSPAPARPAAGKTGWLSAATVAAIVAALWLAFDLPAQDARSVVASLTPIAAMHCVSASKAAEECAAPVRALTQPAALTSRTR
jgi:hypothetical protein